MSEEREDVFSKAVRAGKRTYFFDVRSTRGGDLFLTITESKKHTLEDGTARYEKHKIFLYKEDFEKFMDGLHEAFDEIDRLKGSDDGAPRPEQERNDESTSGEEGAPAAPRSSFGDVDFDDLGRP